MEFIDLNLMDYHRAFALQKRYVAEKIDGILEKNVVLLLEHPRVFTLGKRGGRENLTVSEEFLHDKGIEVVQTKRGGNITFHGPGQLVCYPIFDLKRARLGVADFVWSLEEIMIKTCLEFGINAGRDKKNHGIWVKNSKIGNIGLSVKRNISFHGTALNVNLDLSPFSWINPCGMKGVSMTSMKREIEKTSHGYKLEMEDIKTVMKKHYLWHYKL